MVTDFRFFHLLSENDILKVAFVLLHVLGESKSGLWIHLVQHFRVDLGDSITVIVLNLASLLATVNHTLKRQAVRRSHNTKLHTTVFI